MEMQLALTALAAAVTRLWIGHWRRHREQESALKTAIHADVVALRQYVSDVVARQASLAQTWDLPTRMHNADPTDSEADAAEPGGCRDRRPMRIANVEGSESAGDDEDFPYSKAVH